MKVDSFIFDKDTRFAFALLLLFFAVYLIIQETNEGDFVSSFYPTYSLSTLVYSSVLTLALYLVPNYRFLFFSF